jgi:hypothetical protein
VAREHEEARLVVGAVLDPLGEHGEPEPLGGAAAGDGGATQVAGGGDVACRAGGVPRRVHGEPAPRGEEARALRQSDRVALDHLDAVERGAARGEQAVPDGEHDLADDRHRVGRAAQGVVRRDDAAGERVLDGEQPGVDRAVGHGARHALARVGGHGHGAPAPVAGDGLLAVRAVVALEGDARRHGAGERGIRRRGRGRHGGDRRGGVPGCGSAAETTTAPGSPGAVRRAGCARSVYSRARRLPWPPEG